MEMANPEMNVKFLFKDTFINETYSFFHSHFPKITKQNFELHSAFKSVEKVAEIHTLNS